MCLFPDEEQGGSKKRSADSAFAGSGKADSAYAGIYFN